MPFTCLRARHLTSIIYGMPQKLRSKERHPRVLSKPTHQLHNPSFLATEYSESGSPRGKDVEFDLWYSAHNGNATSWHSLFHRTSYSPSQLFFKAKGIHHPPSSLFAFSFELEFPSYMVSSLPKFCARSFGFLYPKIGARISLYLFSLPEYMAHQLYFASPKPCTHLSTSISTGFLPFSLQNVTPCQS